LASCVYGTLLSKKSIKIGTLIESFQGLELDPHYLGFFDCFNKELFFEAHEVLEELWLRDRGANYSFYKGLIQFAGAFVHLQKNRLPPAGALFRLAEKNLNLYPAQHLRFDIAQAVETIRDWLHLLEVSSYGENPLRLRPPPKLVLIEIGSHSS
jgi:hypothetical protein